MRKDTQVPKHPQSGTTHPGSLGGDAANENFSTYTSLREHTKEEPQQPEQIAAEGGDEDEQL